MRRLRLIVGLSAAMPLLGLGQSAATTWVDTFESRLEILALTQTLNAEILAGSSATQSLEKWCRDHKMAADPFIVARLVAGVDKAPPSEQLQRLQVATAATSSTGTWNCGAAPTSCLPQTLGMYPAV